MRMIGSSRGVRALVTLVAGTLFLAGCGDDGGTDAGSDTTAGGEATGAAADDGARYCELAAELESGDSEPTDEQLDELVAAAPEEIRSDVETFTAAIRTHEMEAEGVAEAEERILAWEEENCV